MAGASRDEPEVSQAKRFAGFQALRLAGRFAGFQAVRLAGRFAGFQAVRLVDRASGAAEQSRPEGGWTRDPAWRGARRFGAPAPRCERRSHLRRNWSLRPSRPRAVRRLGRPYVCRYLDRMGTLPSSMPVHRVIFQLLTQLRPVPQPSTVDPAILDLWSPGTAISRTSDDQC